MRTRDNLIVDAAIAAIYLLAANPGVTGVPAHEWVSLGFATLALTHVVLHGDWAARSFAGFAKRASTRSRVSLVLDVVSGVAVTAVVVSGLAISRTIAGIVGLAWTASPAWRTLHTASAAAVLALIVVHVAVHRAWIMTACRLHIVAPLRAALPGPRPRVGSRAIALAIPALLVAATLGLATLALTGAGATANARAASTSGTGTSDQVLTCPRTGCTAPTCHATSGLQGGGGRSWSGG